MTNEQVNRGIDRRTQQHHDAEVQAEKRYLELMFEETFKEFIRVSESRVRN